MGKKYWNISAWLLIGAFAAWGNQIIDLESRVVSLSGQPVAGATINLVKNGLSAITAENGLFHLTGTVGIAGDCKAVGASRGMHIHKKFVELGVVTDASVRVFSTNGALLNRLSVTKQSRIPVDILIPPTVASQTIVMSVTTARQTVNLKAIRYGDRWLWNAASATLGASVARKRSAELFAVDTLRVTKAGMQTTNQPVNDFIGALDDIVMYTLSEADSRTSGMMGDVQFSEPSKTFMGKLSVTMSTPIVEAKVRYTVDGSLPTASSTLYNDTALTLSSTTQLRACAFIDTSSIGNPSTAIYIARAIEATSDIPLIIMDGFGKGKPTRNKSIYLDLAFMVFEPVNGVASIANTPAIATRAGYHLRGQSSMMFAQAPYKVELRDNNNRDTDYPLLGMPWGSDWALISPYSDNTLIRNVFAFALGSELGLATMQYRFAEVYINQDSNPLDTSDYQGVYTVIQTIKNEKGRLNLKQLHKGDTDPSEISGGYILKFDQMAMDTSEEELECKGAKDMSTTGSLFGTGSAGKKPDSTATCWDDLELVDPAPANSQQIAWITDYIQHTHDALHANPSADWEKYLDMNSFVNMFLLNEITRNVDAWIRSAYMYKNRGQPLKSGPVWDYNFALNNFATDTVGWHVEENRRGYNDWHTCLWKQPEFKTAVRARWEELRPDVLSDASIAKLIDNVRAPIKNAAERDLKKWPIGKSSIFEGNFGGALGKAHLAGGMFGIDTTQPKTWDGQIDRLKSWTKTRMKSLDSSMATLPRRQ